MYSLHSDFLFNFLLIGNQQVGKSALMNCICGTNFPSVYVPTIGIDFVQFNQSTYTLRINEKGVKLHIWDTAGNPRFKAITAAYFRGAQMIAIVVDVNEPESLQGVKEHMREMRRSTSSNLAVCLVGNKCDSAERAISMEAGAQFAHDLGLPYLETSAKTSHNVFRLFTFLTWLVLSSPQHPHTSLPQTYVRIAILGDAGVGKTSFLTQYTEYSFNEGYTHTSGLVTVSDIQVNAGLYVYGMSGTLEIQETSDQKSAAESGAHGCFVLFDLSDRRSFEGVNEWVKSVRKVRSPDFKIVLVGAKCDKTHSVTTDECTAFAKSHRIPYIAASAKTGKNVIRAVESLAIDIVTAQRMHKEDSPEAVKLWIDKWRRR